MRSKWIVSSNMYDTAFIYIQAKEPIFTLLRPGVNPCCALEIISCSDANRITFIHNEFILFEKVSKSIMY